MAAAAGSQVGPERERPPAEAAHQPGHLFRLVVARQVREGDVGALRRQSPHDLRPDAAAAAGYQRHPPGQPSRDVHGIQYIRAAPQAEGRVTCRSIHCAYG